MSATAFADHNRAGRAAEIRAPTLCRGEKIPRKFFALAHVHASTPSFRNCRLTWLESKSPAVSATVKLLPCQPPFMKHVDAEAGVITLELPRDLPGELAWEGNRAALIEALREPQ